MHLIKQHQVGSALRIRTNTKDMAQIVIGKMSIEHFNRSKEDVRWILADGLPCKGECVTIHDHAALVANETLHPLLGIHTLKEHFSMLRIFRALEKGQALAIQTVTK
ncbi:hypothetical protein D3C76_1554610 [compost metagenome]